MRVELVLDGQGTSDADTGLPFLDHMLQQLGRHAGWDLSVTSRGDLDVDGHHTVEDVGLALGAQARGLVGIVLGSAFAEALGDKAGVRRFASIVVPLDEAAVEVALDLSGRNFVLHEVDVPAETIGSFDTGLVEDFVRAFAQAADLTVHVRLRSGRSPHHVVEAEFKRRRPEHEANAVTIVAQIAVLDYGSGNLHSVSRALAHVGGEPIVTSDPLHVAAADALVIPGVGHFGHCMRAIRAKGLDRAIAEAVGTGKRVFGVCVGMQVLFERSDEDPEIGLGVLPGVSADSRTASRCRISDGTRSPGSARTLTRRRSPIGRGSTSCIPTPRIRTTTRWASPSTDDGSRPWRHATTCSRRSSTPRSRARPGWRSTRTS